MQCIGRNNILRCTVAKTANRKPQHAFTLIELVIVAAIVSVISLAIYSALNNGLKIWQKANQQLVEEDLNLFFDKFSRDLRNVLKFTDIGFSGNAERLEFAAIIDSPRLQKRTVGEVVYSFDPGAGILNREQRDFSHIFDGKPGIVMQALKNISSVKFNYYVYDENTGEYHWYDQWLAGELPLAVRIELELRDGFSARSFTKTVSLPISAYPAHKV